MFRYTPFPCFTKLQKTHLSLRYARCWTTPRSVGVLPQIILFVLNCAFRALSCIPCTPITHWSWRRYKRQALSLCRDLLSFLLIVPSGMGSTVLNSEDWRFCAVFLVQNIVYHPEFRTSSALLFLFFFGGEGGKVGRGLGVGFDICEYGIACATLMGISAFWIQWTQMLCFSSCIYTAIQDTETNLIPSTYYPLKKSLLQCLWYVYYIFSDSFISVLIKKTLSEVN